SRDFQAVFRVSVPVLILTLNQAAFDVYLFALCKVLTRDLRELAPNRHPKPGRDLLWFTRTIFAAFRRRNGEVADGCSVRCVSQFGVSAEVAHNSYLVKRSHDCPPDWFDFESSHNR